jgi:hypothetical protein
MDNFDKKIVETLANITKPNNGLVIKNNVKFIKDFGLNDDWKDFKVGDFIKSDIPNLVIDNFEHAIRIVKQSGIKNVQLRQDSKGSTMEWDNF